MFAAISVTDGKYRDEPLELRACRSLTYRSAISVKPAEMQARQNESGVL
jgi:hypothetical protein